MEDRTKKSFIGIGFDTIGIPIDILPIYLLNSFLDDYSLLIVDEFLKMNGKDHRSIEEGQDKLFRVLERLKVIYCFEPKIICCSEFMGSDNYKIIFQKLKEKVQNTELMDLVLKTVPENKRHLDSARDYPLHELACVEYLSKIGFSLKIGPGKEKEYDIIMKKLDFPVSFAYLLEAYALGTKTADEVVHYVPTSRGPNNGQRIFFENDEQKIKVKLQQGCDEALRYFCRIASVSGHLLGLDNLDDSEIRLLYGKKLKQETIRLFLDNVVKPYREVM